MPKGNGIKERRRFIRVPLVNEDVYWKYSDSLDIHHNAISDFSPYGCFIEAFSSSQSKPGSYITLFFTLPGDLGTLEVSGQTKWNRWHVGQKDAGKYPLGFGVEFKDVLPGPQKILDSLAVYLRNKQIIAVTKRIIETYQPHQIPPNGGGI